MWCRLTACTILLVALGSPVEASLSITLVGDEHLGVVMREVAGKEGSGIETRDGVYELTVESAGVTLRSLVPGGGAMAMADLLHTSDIALIVIDAARGPAPIIREHVIVARQARVPMLALLVANVDAVFAAAPTEAVELIALEVREIRELLSAYDLAGNAVQVYTDSPPKSPLAGIAAHGSHEALLALARFHPRRVRTADPGRVSRIWSAVYLLTNAESGGDAVRLAAGDTIGLWSEGTRSQATLESMTDYEPGDFREMPLRMAEPVRGIEGSRILLIRDNRVVGLGAITQILE